MVSAKKVLFIGSVWPEPKSSAGGTRLMQLIKYFRKSYPEVYYASAAAPSEYAEDLGQFDVVTKSILLNDSSFDSWINELRPDVVIYDRFMTEEQFSWRVRTVCPETIHVLETIDLHCLRKAREQVLKKGGLVKDYLMESEDALREIGSILRSDLTLMISSFEMELLTNTFKVDQGLLMYLPYEAPSSILTPRTFEEKRNFISIVNFKHAPNWDAVLWLKKEIWPMIRKELPKAKLLVCGSYPDEKVWQLNNDKEGFVVKGRVEDALFAMSDARVLLAPLRFGAGIKGKLVESMLMDTPNVTTAIGVEGLIFEGRWNGVVVEDAEQIASEAVRLYQDQEYWKSKVEEGRFLLSHQFASELHQKQFLDRVDVLVKGIENHRKQNFLGRLLNHDLMQRSKYFSRWIEEKEKKLS